MVITIDCNYSLSLLETILLKNVNQLELFLRKSVDLTYILSHLHCHFILNICANSFETTTLNFNRKIRC